MDTPAYTFTNDYSEAACPEVLDALLASRASQNPGYTTDGHCSRAARLILQQCGLGPDDASVFFLVGGTAANITGLLGLLRRPYDAVVCTPDGHINTHEAGALEATGHKILTTPDTDGFLHLEPVKELVAAHAAFGNHMVRPAVLYISQSTELGGVYQKDHIVRLSDYAHAHDMSLFIDGARMASALTSEAAGGLDLPALAAMADAFTLGGTKNGLLFGEALVLRHPQARADLPWLMKRQANLLAKGWLLGLQFEAVFTGGACGSADEALYWKYGRHANRQARRVAEIMQQHGFELASPPVSNQVFVHVDSTVARNMCAQLACETFFEDSTSGRSVIRLVCSWASTDAQIQYLEQVVSAL